MMYLVRGVGTTNDVPSPPGRKKRAKHHPYEEWVKMRHKIHEADIRRKTRTKAISDFLRRVMPDRDLPSYPEPDLANS